MFRKDFCVGKVLKLNCEHRSINSILYGIDKDEIAIVLKKTNHTNFKDYLVYTIISQKFFEVADFELSEIVI